jgi:hypothetical protein
MNASVAVHCAFIGYYRLVIVSEGGLQRMNAPVAVESLVTTDWSLYLRVGYKE